MIFIPKVGRTCCTSIKDIRPISLTQHGNQHAYRMGFSNDLMKGGYTMGTFLDIKDAFNNIFYEVCREAALRGVPNWVVQ
ncbi:hypothetical protein ACFW04_014143 [Cataglyphis niger]